MVYNTSIRQTYMTPLCLIIFFWSYSLPAEEKYYNISGYIQTISVHHSYICNYLFAMSEHSITNTSLADKHFHFYCHKSTSSYNTVNLSSIIGYKVAENQRQCYKNTMQILESQTLDFVIPWQPINGCVYVYVNVGRRLGTCSVS